MDEFENVKEKNYIKKFCFKTSKLTYSVEDRGGQGVS